MEKNSSFNSFTLKHILCLKSIKTLIQVPTYYIYTYIYILYMDETYFNVVYFFNTWLFFKVIAIQLNFVQKVCFEVYFKHYRTKYFIFHILYVAHSIYSTYVVFKLLFKKWNSCYKCNCLKHPFFVNILVIEVFWLLRLNVKYFKFWPHSLFWKLYAPTISFFFSQKEIHHFN